MRLDFSYAMRFLPCVETSVRANQNCSFLSIKIVANRALNKAIGYISFF